MDAGDFMRVRLGWFLPEASEPVYNVYNFRCSSAVSPSALQIVGSDIVDAFIPRYVTPLLPFQATNTILTQVELRSYNDATEIYTRSGVLASGSGSSACLPPFVTFNIQETRFDPTIRNGRIALPGIALNTGDGEGKIAPTVVASVNTVLEGWSSTEFFVEGPDYVFEHVIARLVDGLNVPPSHAVAISAYNLAIKYGTQNSRK